MKKTLLFAAAVLALVACSKENVVKEEGPIDASKIVFNIQVENADATKAVKTTWENGDVVYAFFEGNSSQYVKMTYNGTSWQYTDKDDGTTFSGLALAASGEKVSAVYMPYFVYSEPYSEPPTFSTDKWTFGSINGYFQTAESVDYTVTSTDDVTTLNATLSLTAPAGISQVFIPSGVGYSMLGLGNEIVLTASHIKPITFNGIAPGGAASYTTGTSGFPLTPYFGCFGSDVSGFGNYCWGILEGAGTYDFTFQLVERNAEKKYAISSKSKSVTDKTVGDNVAIKLSGLTDNGKFVSLGYAGGPLWATGNLKETSLFIADPLEAGDHYKWGYTTPYDVTGATDAYLKYKADADFEDTAAAKNINWRIPTKAQFDDLINSSYTETVWKTDWTNIGRLITSKVNGISLFFAAAGHYTLGSLLGAGDDGLYWSSTPIDDSDGAYDLYFGSGDICTDSSSRLLGFSVRPVKAAPAPAP